MIYTNIRQIKLNLIFTTTLTIKAAACSTFDGLMVIRDRDPEVPCLLIIEVKG